MDVDSYLPYEGKVVLHNKQAHTAMIHIPAWVESDKIQCFVNDSAVIPPRAGRYLMFEELKEQDKIRLEFPVPESTDKYTINGREYKVSFRGSTVVDIEPRNTGPKLYPLYQRDLFKANKAPLRKIRRFVADRIIPLGTY